jgi:uncharacterized protein
MPNFADRVTLDSPRLTGDGYLVATVRCARTGCQQYDAAELGLTDRQGVVTVYRPESAVFDKDSMATYAGKPVTVNHPPVMVTADNWKEYAAGEVGAEIARDGEFVVVPMKLMDRAAIDAVQAGTREISMGYTTPLELVDGVAPDGTPYQAVQTGPIRINHLAIVPQARGGSQLRIGDGANKWGASPLTDAETKEGHMPDLRKILVDGLQVETTDAGATAIAKLQGQLKDAMTEKEKADKEYAEKMAEKDAELAKKDAAIAKLEGDTLTDAALDARVAARADLVAKALRVADGLTVAGLSDGDIRKAAVAKALGDAAVEGKAQAYIDARFDILVEGAEKADPVQKMKDAPAPKLTTLDAVYTERNKALESAWKTKGAA